jgi:long-chain acyl-CoA synthetase
MQLLGEMLESTVRSFPQNTAIICEGREIDYLTFNNLVNKTAFGLLKLGIGSGDRVMLYMTNSIEFIICHFALIKIGAIAVPLNVMYKAQEISYIANDTESATIITQKKLLDNVFKLREDFSGLKNIISTGEQLPPGIMPFSRLTADSPEGKIAPGIAGYDHVVSIIYTSGTTGRPKGATQTHRSILTNVLGLRPVNKFGPEDRLVCALPLYNNFGLNVVMMSAFNCGAGLIVLERFEAEKVLEAISLHRGSCFFGTPTMYIYLTEKHDPQKYDVSSLRVVNCGGAPCPDEVVKGFESIFGAVFMNGYGQTEACGFTTLNPYDGIRKKNSAGVPVAGVWLKIVDNDGKKLAPGQVREIVLKGDVFSVHGYWRREEINKEIFKNGWFHSGDLGYLDEDGYLYIVDRKQDLIITGGQNIYPAEVEEVIYTHPKVSMAAVIGVPDKIKGELAKAYIVLKEGEVATEEEIINFVRERIAKFKAPRMVEFVDSFPLGPTGKILKRTLREQVRKKLEYK